MTLTPLSRERLDTVHPDLRTVILAAVDRTTQPVQISEGYRSQERQDQLYAQGRTQPGRIVTWTRNSRHTARMAADVVMIVDGNADWTVPRYDDFARTVKATAGEMGVPLIWGGDWTSTKDRPHFELPRDKYMSFSTSYLDSKPFDAQVFETIVGTTLDIEQGWNPDDPSMRGITKETYERYLGRPVTIAELQAITEEEAKKIYRALYWGPVLGDDLPPGINLAVFDFAVHSGPPVAVRNIQEVVGSEADAIMGPVTLAAIRAMPADEAIDAYMDARLEHMRGHENWEKYKNGWTRRVERVRGEALGMAEQEGGTPPGDDGDDEEKEPVSTEELRDILIGRGYSVDLAAGPRRT